MTAPDYLSRRAMLMRLGIFFNAVIAAVLAVPVVGYLFSPLARARKMANTSWIPLGSLDQFPAGETRLATFRNSDVQPWDGQTADSACWVRCVDAQTFQIFAINCMHLGCPVRWFPQSRLFMCPCHGGVYYEDGARASGPPERGLFEYAYKVEDGKLFINALDLPTPGTSSALINIDGKLPCA